MHSPVVLLGGFGYMELYVILHTHKTRKEAQFLLKKTLFSYEFASKMTNNVVVLGIV